ncbi:hypothetical protein GCM10012288_12490 [Malaciobacter pacificus]|jgi:hypothetical protein|uniref:Uncharacterized protein n=1 Tax=Malaciobacter pacificus TaxID=1080223 RepID=A0A5C2H5J0_9BACT|nr:hypothetical protein [Malaciobacter pacificus]QEP34240.1 hypothetical protein APAC_1115 [Malaciobacter pacificus]GGD39947.1 hypothetical protein GCM10012288_12490 [Malaciobacter pacificus]
MDYIKELEEIVKNDVLIEISQNIKELNEAIKDSKKNKDLKEELKYMEQVKLYFDEVILDIENKTMTQEQALDILEGLEDMRADNQEV